MTPVGIGSKECFRGNGKAFALQGSHYFFIARITAAAELVCFLDKERVLRIKCRDRRYGLLFHRRLLVGSSYSVESLDAGD